VKNDPTKKARKLEYDGEYRERIKNDPIKKAMKSEYDREYRENIKNDPAKKARKIEYFREYREKQYEISRVWRSGVMNEKYEKSEQEKADAIERFNFLLLRKCLFIINAYIIISSSREAIMNWLDNGVDLCDAKRTILKGMLNCLEKRDINTYRYLFYSLEEEIGSYNIYLRLVKQIMIQLKGKPFDFMLGPTPKGCFCGNVCIRTTDGLITQYGVRDTLITKELASEGCMYHSRARAVLFIENYSAYNSIRGFLEELLIAEGEEKWDFIKVTSKGNMDGYSMRMAAYIARSLGVPLIVIMDGDLGGISQARILMEVVGEYVVWVGIRPSVAKMAEDYRWDEVSNNILKQVNSAINSKRYSNFPGLKEELTLLRNEKRKYSASVMTKDFFEKIMNDAFSSPEFIKIVELNGDIRRNHKALLWKSVNGMTDEKAFDVNSIPPKSFPKPTKAISNPLGFKMDREHVIKMEYCRRVVQNFDERKAYSSNECDRGE
ncbi:hypothetical protein PMAYCL1PPCAC_18568, partial [Pristionchus mayeri]